MNAFFSRYWYRKNIPWFLYVLFPFSLVYRSVQRIRFLLYQSGIFKTHSFSVPVIVISNKVAGGTGKTPMAIALLSALKKAGFKPGLVTRGYGGRAVKALPVRVTPESDPVEVGDEPVLIAKRSGCPVAAGHDRVKAVQSLLTECNVILSDDGGLHYAMGRHIELVLHDAMRGEHNGMYLPMGPLRDPNPSVSAVTLAVNHVREILNDGAEMALIPTGFHRLSDDSFAPLASMKGKIVYGVAGIGHPKRFFDTLRRLGMLVMENPFPDHYDFSEEDFAIWKDSENAIIMTEKDAVKCAKFDLPNAFFLRVEAELSGGIVRRCCEELERSRHCEEQRDEAIQK